MPDGEHLRTHDFHTRHALVQVDVAGWTYTGVCACGHRGPRFHSWPEHPHALLDEHLVDALGEEGQGRPGDPI